METFVSKISWGNIKKGDYIPKLIKKPTPIQLFMFSAVTWNRHLIHYNKDYALSDGLPDIVVHRALVGNFLAQMLTNWIGDSGKLLKVEWSVRKASMAGDTLICQGKVLEKRIEETKRIIECDIWVENQDGVVTGNGKSLIVITI